MGLRPKPGQEKGDEMVVANVAGVWDSHFMSTLDLDHTVVPKYPDITVQLTEEDGNAFFIIGRVTRAMKEAGLSADLRAEFTDEAMSGDYNNVIQTTMRWVSVA